MSSIVSPPPPLTKAHLPFTKTALAPTVKRCYKQVLQSLNQNTSLILLKSHPGSGTSTLLKLLQRVCNSNSVLYLKGSAGLTPLNILKAIGLKMSIQPKRHAAIEEALVQILRSAHKNNQQLTLIIDNAECLPPSAIQCIEKITDIQSQQTIIRTILSSSTSCPGLSASTPVDVIQLQRLSLRDTEQHLIALTHNQLTNEQIQTLSRSAYQSSSGNLRETLITVAKSISATRPQPDKQTHTPDTASTHKLFSKPSTSFLGLVLIGIGCYCCLPSPANQSWAIQLSATLTDNEASTIMNQVPQAFKNKILRYTAMRNGKKYHIILLAPFSSQAASKEALQLLPNALKSGKPWVRDTRSVKKESVSLDSLLL